MGRGACFGCVISASWPVTGPPKRGRWCHRMRPCETRLNERSRKWCNVCSLPQSLVSRDPASRRTVERCRYRIQNDILRCYHLHRFCKAWFADFYRPSMNCSFRRLYLHFIPDVEQTLPEDTANQFQPKDHFPSPDGGRRTRSEGSRRLVYNCFTTHSKHSNIHSHSNSRHHDDKTISPYASQ